MEVWDITGQKMLMEGTQAWQSGNRDQAMTIFQNVVDQYPERPEGYNKIGVIYAQTGELDAAERYFLTALSMDRAHAPSLTNLGNIYLERGDLDNAIQHYTLALASDSSYAPAHRNLSVAYRKQGHLNRSVTHLKRSQRLETQHQREDFRMERALRAGHAPPERKSGGANRFTFSSRNIWWIVIIGVAVYITLKAGHL